MYLVIIGNPIQIDSKPENNRCWWEKSDSQNLHDGIVIIFLKIVKKNLEKYDLSDFYSDSGDLYSDRPKYILEKKMWLMTDKNHSLKADRFRNLRESCQIKHVSKLGVLRSCGT